MAHYDGPVFRTDEQDKQPSESTMKQGYQLPPQKHSVDKHDDQPTYHSVDPMSQFVTPRSTAPRRKQKTVNFDLIQTKMRRVDAAVVLLATDADDAVPFTDAAVTVTPAAPSEVAPVTPASEVPSVDDETPVPAAAPVEEVAQAPVTPVVVDDPIVAPDILTQAAKDAETDHIPATLTELAEQGQRQREQARKRQKPAERKQAQRNAVTRQSGGLRPNRLNIHQAFSQYKSGKH